MPYANVEDQRACDARWRTRHLHWRRASRRQWNRTHRPYCARIQARSVRRRRLTVFRRDGWRCVYCRRRGTSRTLTLDHKIPRKDGGKGTPENLLTACRSCNQRKGIKPYDVFMERMRAELGLEPMWITEEPVYGLSTGS